MAETVQPSFPYNEWVQRFAAHFRVLQPLRNDAQCIEIAVAAHPSSNDLSPEDAAGVFSEILDAKVPVSELRGWLPEIR